MDICASQHNIHDVEIEYANLRKKCFDYIVKIKQTNINESIISIVETFCYKNGIEVELMGDAIADDVYFKELILMDQTGEQKTESTNLELSDW